MSGYSLEPLYPRCAQKDCDRNATHRVVASGSTQQSPPLCTLHASRLKQRLDTQAARST